MRRSLTVLCFAATALLQGCATRPFHNELFQASLNTPYALASGDRVRVIVFGPDALSNSYSIGGAGSISMPLIGDVPIFGMTTTEAEHVIEGRLRNGYLRDPRVSIEVEAFRPFFVMGEVAAPGQYPFINGMTIQKAIAVAGGFTPRGYQGGVEVTRVINGRPEVGRFPLDYPIRPGDTVTAEERIF